MTIIQTRPLLAPLHAALLALLDATPDTDWQRPTILGTWRVRDVAAHLLDVMLRRLSAGRDAHRLDAPAGTFDSFETTTAWLNELNHTWVRAADRLSPRVIRELLAVAGPAAVAWLSSRPADAPADFPVGWAGESASQVWMDVGREYTEWWLHQQHLRLALEAPLQESPEWLGPVLQLFVRALPRAYGALAAPEGTVVRVTVTGPSGLSRLLVVSHGGWALQADDDRPARAVATLADRDAWRLWSKSLRGRTAAEVVQVTGDAALAAPVLAARAIMG